MDTRAAQHSIEQAWEAHDEVTATTHGGVREAVEAALEELDVGRLRVAGSIA